MTHRAALLAAFALAASAAAGGCGISQAQHDQLAERLAECEQARDELRREADALRQEHHATARQIETLQALGEKRLELLYHVQQIKLARHTGGVNLDDQPGDDGVRVYLRPVDQYGSVIKAAGSVKIELFDLAAETEANRLSSCSWSVKEAGEHWSGGLLSPQYSFDCPWSAGPPEHEQIAVRVEFVDYLTGRIFSAQTVCEVKLPPAGE